MRRTILFLVVIVAMLSAYAGTAMSQTSPSEILDANSLPKITSALEAKSTGILNADWFAKAQTFTAINSGALTSAQIQIYKVCETASDVRMQIATVDDSGFPTNDILAETTLPASAFAYAPAGNVGDLVTVKFSNPAQVEAGQKYAFIFRLESPTVGCAYLQPLKGDVYSGGSYAVFTGKQFPDAPSTDQWEISTLYDHVFSIYVTPLDPTSKAACKKGGYKEFGFKNQGRCIAFVNRAARSQ